jgi:hypothetical protein
MTCMNDGNEFVSKVSSSPGPRSSIFLLFASQTQNGPAIICGDLRLDPGSMLHSDAYFIHYHDFNGYDTQTPPQDGLS